MFVFQINQATHEQALVLQNALQSIPNPASECMLRNVAIRLAQQISDEVPDLHQFRAAVRGPLHADIHDFVVFLRCTELLPGFKVHPRHLRDPSRAEDRVGFGLWDGASGLQLERGDQQDLREGMFTVHQRSSLSVAVLISRLSVHLSFRRLTRVTSRTLKTSRCAARRWRS